MENKINLIVKSDENNLRIDVFVNNKEKDFAPSSWASLFGLNYRDIITIKFD